jgi:hypothetical protein
MQFCFSAFTPLWCNRYDTPFDFLLEVEKDKNTGKFSIWILKNKNFQ